jgi:type I restriction enzyme S subunit
VNVAPKVDGCSAVRHTTIGAVCDRFDGEVQTGPFGSQLHASDYSDEGIPVVMPQDMVDGRISCASIARVDETHARRLRQHRLRNGDIVFSRRGDVSRFAVVAEQEEGWLCGTGSIRIRLNCSEVDTGYLRHFLKRNEIGSWLLHHAKGVTMPNLNTTIVRALPFSYPPLDEQRRIAAVLDKADELRRKRKRALDLLDSLAQSIFKSIESKEHWPRIPFGEAVYFQEGPGIRNWQFRDSGIKLVNVRNIVDGVLNTENTSRFLSEEEVTNRYKHFLLEAGDFVLASSGVTWGKIAEVKTRDLPICLNTSMIRIRPRAPFSKAYVRSFIEFGDFRSQIDRLITGSAQPNFGPSHLKQVLIPKMPADLQDTLEKLSINIGSVRKTSGTLVDVSDVLFSSLQSRAFSGQL